MPNGTYSGRYSTAIYLDASFPTVTIASTAIVSVASGDAIDGGLGSAYTVDNAGTIEAPSGFGIYLQAGGLIDNGAGGRISGSNGVGLTGPGSVYNAGYIGASSRNASAVILGASSALTNAGTVEARGRYAEGVYTGNSDDITNLAGGTIVATGVSGIAVVAGLAASVVNSGVIKETGGGEVVQIAYGAVTNLAGGTISGGIGIQATAATASTVVNRGEIAGTYAGIEFYGTGAITNSGSGTVSGNYAVLMLAGGTVTNGPDGKIYGHAAGVKVDGSIGDIKNYGLIRASPGYDIDLFSGGTIQNYGSLLGKAGINAVDGGAVVNAAGGRITNRHVGIRIQGAGGSIANAGYVAVSGANGMGVGLSAGDSLSNSGTIAASGAYGDAIYIGGPAYVANAAGGTILAAGASGFGLLAEAVATIVNEGLIDESGGGIGIQSEGGMVENDAGASIAAGIGVEFQDASSGTLVDDGVVIGSTYGVEVLGAATVTIIDSGTIASSAGASGTAIDFKSGDNLLLLSPTSGLIGEVEGGVGITRVELLAGSDTGTLTGLGTQFVDITEVLVDAGADWQLGGSNTVALGTTLLDRGMVAVDSTAGLTDRGLVEVYGAASVLDVESALLGSGTIEIAGGGTVNLGAGASGETIRFGAGGGTLTLADPLAASLTIDGFGQLDAVDLTGIGYSALADRLVESAGRVTVEQNGTVVAEFAVGGSTTLALESDGHGGTAIVNTGSYAGVYSGSFYQPIDVHLRSVTLSTGVLVDVTQSSGIAVYGSPGKRHAITNTGEIVASGSGGTGVDIAAGGSFTNKVAGTVAAGDAGVILGGHGDAVENAGAIAAVDVGIDLLHDGNVENYGEITVSGASGFGVELGGGAAADVLVNEGMIAATGSDATAVQLAGGNVVNDRGGTVEGPMGIRVIGSGASVDNEGSIVASGGTGIYLGAGGVVVNGAYGVIASPMGIRVIGSGASVVNRGMITSAGTSVGIELGAEGYVDNAAGGRIVTPDGIRVIGSGASVINQGEIGSGTGTGVYLSAGGVVVNAAHATVSGTIGVELGASGAGKVIDYGTIEGTSYAVEFLSARDRLVVHSGAAFDGRIAGGGGRLKVADGRGNISGLGSSGTMSGSATGEFSGFGAYVFGSAADWTLSGSDSLGVGQSLINDGTLTVDGTLTLASPLSGHGTIVIGDGSTLDLQSGATGIADFKGGDGILQLGDPAGVTLAIAVFAAGDTIDLSGLAYSSGDSFTYDNSTLTVVQGDQAIISFDIYDLPSGTAFTLEADGKGGTDIVVDQSVGNPKPVVSLPTAQTVALDAALQTLAEDVGQSEGVAKAALNFFTPPTLDLPAASGHLHQPTTPVPGEVNIENGAPAESGQTLHLGAGVNGIILTGANAAELVGRAGAVAELLVGNEGNDTIRGGGGSGTIISGSGANLIRAGSGAMLVISGGADTIHAGKGHDTIEAYGNATVYGGAGKTIFEDLSNAGDGSLVMGGSGTTVMKSGLGQDTFIGGSGRSRMIDTGHGDVAFQFNIGSGGSDIVTGFDAAAGDYIRVTANSWGASQILGAETVTGGNTYIDLSDGTKIEFVGITNLTASDFHA